MQARQLIRSACRRTPVRLRDTGYALPDDPLHHLAIHVREAVVASAEEVGELRVVDAHEVEDRGVEVMDVDLVLDRVPAELVRGAVDLAAFDAAAGQPHAEAERMVLAPV